MDKRDFELQALQNLQTAMGQVQEIEKQIAQHRKKIQDITDNCKKNNQIPKPVFDDSKSSQVLHRKYQLEETDKSDVSIPDALICLAMAILGLVFGGGIFKKLLALVAVACGWISFFTSIIGGFIGTGLAVWIGWGTWSKAPLVWQIVLIGLSVLHLVFTIIFNSGLKNKKKKEKKLDEEYYEARKTEQYRYEQALEVYEAAVAAIAEENLAAEKPNIDAIEAQISKLECIKLLTTKSIADNAILADEDKKPEVISYVISRLQRKRAESLSEALRQYDQEQREHQDRIYKTGMERLEQRQRAQKEAEDFMRRREHEWNVEREQRRQADELETIRRKLEEN